MFIIGGISPKTKTLDQNPRVCPACGLAQAYLKRIDQYLNLFFIPLFRIKKGEPFIYCKRCQNTGFLHHQEATPHSRTAQCHSCGRAVSAEFSFCPFCGKRL